MNKFTIKRILSSVYSWNRPRFSQLTKNHQTLFLQQPFSSIRCISSSNILGRVNNLNKLSSSNFIFNLKYRLISQGRPVHSKDVDNSSNVPNPDKSKSVGILSGMFGEDPNQNKLKNEKNSEEKEEKKSKEETTFEKSQRYSKWMLIISLSISTPLFIIQRGRPLRTEDGDIIEDQYSKHMMPIAYTKRAWGELMSVKRELIEPSSKKLLPDPLKEPYYQPPYTLVMELMDVLLHPVYDSVTGWRFKKRPGIDYFLSQVGPPMYEVVIFTTENGMTAHPLIQSMDSKGYIMYSLFRDSARYKVGFSKGNIMKGEMPKLDPYYQKDLRFLNRDLKKVIMIDCDQKAFEKNPDNGLCIKKWDGSTDDSTLYDLASLLRAIAVSNVDDVREVVRYYNSKEDPIEAFKEAQKQMEDDEKLMKEKNQANPPQMSFLGKGLNSWLKI